jgi:hypothetical protein
MTERSRLALRFVLLLVSLVAGLAVSEVLLRVFVPRYEEAASGRYREDLFRLKTRVANQATTREHPDTGRRHPVLYNGLAMRQHREIAPRKTEGEERVGIFGDSFTENLGLDSPYSYTEVLDYLLNLHPGRRFTVLNFGIVGYGTDQSYVYYRSSPYARDLDAVVYQFCVNDIRNLYENQLFELDDGGKLVQKPVPPRPLWMSVASRLYLTYLFLELRERLRSEPEPFPEEDADAGPDLAPLGEKAVRRELRLAQRERSHDENAERIQSEWLKGVPSESALYYESLLSEIVREWRQEVESGGGRFYVLLVPRPEEHSAEARIFPDVPLVDLWKELQIYGDLRPFFFQKDGHWNELGNLFAALHLYERLAPALGLEPLAREMLEEALYVYYRAFPDWTPTRGVRETSVDPAELARIRERYAGLVRQREISALR